MVMNYKEKEEKYNDILSGLNENLEGLVGRLKDDIKAQNKVLNPITAEMPDSCGSMERNAFNENEQLTAQDLTDVREAEFNISEIKAEILSNKIKFPDSAYILPPDAIGEGKGGDIGTMSVPESEGGEPEWFSKIEAGIGELIGFPKMGRKNIDYEGAQTYISQGIAVFRKAKTKVIDDDKEVIVLLDQSGSMGSYTEAGVSFLDLLSQFIPDLAKKYSGQMWVCDSCSMSDYDKDPKFGVPNAEEPLKDVDKRIIYHGGGGTSFNGAFRKLGDIEKTKQKDNPDYEMCVIFFSDMFIGESEFRDYKKYGPTKQIWVTAKGSRRVLEEKAPWVRSDENIKEVYIDMLKTENKDK
tara:strand:+ start:320 stop:1381 length:1062 start_codon:yes stop_codon:yes gene_type:complete